MRDFGLAARLRYHGAKSKCPVEILVPAVVLTFIINSPMQHAGIKAPI